jgi:hypothetical protein
MLDINIVLWDLSNKRSYPLDDTAVSYMDSAKKENARKKKRWTYFGFDASVVSSLNLLTSFGIRADRLFI